MFNEGKYFKRDNNTYNEVKKDIQQNPSYSKYTVIGAKLNVSHLFEYSVIFEALFILGAPNSYKSVFDTMLVR